MADATTADRIEADTVACKVDLPDLIQRYNFKLVRRGRRFVGLCPFHAERTPSFNVFFKGDRWRFHCFGCSVKGDAIAFVMRIERRDFVDALNYLAVGVGLIDPVGRERVAMAAAARAAKMEEDERRYREFTMAEARQIWRESMPAAGTLVETYLRARGIRPELQGGIPVTLRFHPLLPIDDDDRPGVQYVLAGMVAAVQAADSRRVIAVHRTFIKADGSGKADVPKKKAMRGPCWTNAVRFDPAGETLAVGEGIETTLSVRQAMRMAEIGTPCWAALSLGNIGEMWIPPCVKTLLILADADSSKPEQAERILRRVAQQQRDRHPDLRVLAARPTPGCDFNDMLRGE